MTVMACFIDADWKMNSVVLEKKQMDEAHTGRKCYCATQSSRKRLPHSTREAGVNGNGQHCQHGSLGGITEGSGQTWSWLGVQATPCSCA